jgi:hypothetical protein
LANPPPAISIVCFTPRRASYPGIFVDNIQKKLGRISREEPQPASPTMDQFLEMFESLRWTLVGMYLCITGGICLLLVFMYTFIARFLINCIEAVRRAPCIFCPI